MGSRALIIVFIFLNALVTQHVRAQDCRIKYEQNSAEQLRQQNVKEIKIHQGVSTDKNKPTDHYFIDKSGCAVKHIRYDFYSGGTEPTMSQFTVRDTGLVKTYIYGRILKDSFQLYEQETTYYTRSGKLLQRIHEEYVDFHTVTINLFDTSNYEAINQTTIKIHPPSDTMQIITLAKNLNSETRIIKEKQNGVWVEREKSISVFKDGKLDNYMLYRYGKEVQHYKHEEEEDELNPLGDLEQENENPLPFNQNGLVDTVYTNDLVGFKAASKSSAKYKAIVHYESSDRNNISYADVLFTKNGLMHRRMSFSNSEMNEAFEYVFYSD